MSVRKRSWKNAAGEVKEAWVVDYVDQKGNRRAKTFGRKKDADAYHATVRVEVRQGIHTPDSASLTIAEAGEAWIKTAEANGLERATITNYKQHLKLHIEPLIGRRKLSQLSAPGVRDFEDQLRENGRSTAMVRKVRTSLSMLLTDAQERGYVNRNVAKELRRGKERKADRRAKGRLKIGIDIPHARRDPRSPAPLTGPLAAIAADGNLLRPASVGATRIALACAPARRQVSPDRSTKIGGWRADRPDPSTGAQRSAGMETGMPAVGPRPRVLQPQGQGRGAVQHCRSRAQAGDGCSRHCRRERQGQVWRASCAPTFLCVVVHQPQS
jgi:hypothetical protein